jgi:hypothetical protein
MDALDYQLFNKKLRELSTLIQRVAVSRGCIMVDLELKYKGFGKYHDGLHPTVEGQDGSLNVLWMNYKGRKHATG